MKALITGIAGQDGYYLAELLLGKGYQVVGAVRSEQIEASPLPDTLAGRVDLSVLEMLDQQTMVDCLAKHRPSELYNLAASTSGSGMYDNPVEVGEVNGLAVARMLEAIRAVDAQIRFCQASSREIFGEATESPQTELTLACPRSPYGAAKLYADAMVRIYRERYGVFACSAILFNHESPRRRLDFVTRKITHGAVRIKLGLSSVLYLGSLEARRDWGYAGDYVQAMWLMLQQSHPEDYVIASGETHSVREFCECAFSYLGLDYRQHVREDAASIRPDEQTLLVGLPEKARRRLGWAPMTSFREMVRIMVDADMDLLTGVTGNFGVGRHV